MISIQGTNDTKCHQFDAQSEIVKEGGASMQVRERLKKVVPVSQYLRGDTSQTKITRSQCESFGSSFNRREELNPSVSGPYIDRQVKGEEGQDKDVHYRMTQYIKETQPSRSQRQYSYFAT